jgi:outer membrane protein
VKRIIPVVALLLAVESAVARGQLTLSEAATRALEHNPELQLDVPARAGSAAESRAVRGGLFPRIDLEASYGGGNNPVYVFGTLLEQRRFAQSSFALPALNTPRPIDNLQTRLVFQQNVWDFGKTARRIQAAGIGVEISERSHDDNVRHTLLALIEAYWGVSLAREAWEAARAALESSESIAARARARVEAGVAVEADLLRADVQLAAARRQEIHSRAEQDVSRAALQRVMSAPLDLPPDETMPLSETTFHVPALEAILASQRELRPDYLRKRAELRQAEMDAAARRADLLPSISVYGAIETDAPSLRNWGGQNWIAAVTMRWNLLAGGTDAARLDVARLRLEQKRSEVAAFESAMELEARRALARHRSSELEVAVTRASERQSLEGLRILRNRYEAGLATITDVLEAESARAAARTALAQMLYQQRMTFAELDFVAGTLALGCASLEH